MIFLKKQFFLFLLLIFAAFLWSPGLCCQQAFIFESVQINSSPNPVGAGARAQAMGGAFIAVADDATAASWNPAGLVQLERPEFSFALSFEHRRKDIDSDSHREACGMNATRRQDFNYFSLAMPVRAFDKNMVVSLNYQRLYDFYEDIEFDQNFKQTGSGGFNNTSMHTDFRQTGALKAFSPAIAVQLTPRFSLGMTFNIWTDELWYDNGWESKRVTRYKGTRHAVLTNPGTGQKEGSLIGFRGKFVTKEKNNDFNGFNFNLGFLWNINNFVTLGGVFKSPLKGSFHRKTYTEYSQYGYTNKKTGRPLSGSSSDRQSMELRFPMSYGVGIAFRFSDTFTMSCDVYRTRWSKFWAKGRYGTTSPITGKPRSQSHVHSTTQVRIGGEYLWVLEKTIIPFRFGLFYDPEPSEKNPDDFFGISFGTGIMIRDVLIDCAYVYRWARNVKADMLPLQQTQADLDQHKFVISMIYHF